MSAETLTNGGVRLRFEDVEASAGSHERLRRFLRPFFETAAVGDGGADLTVRFRPAADFAADVRTPLDERLTIRRGSDPRFELAADAGRDERGRLVAFDAARLTGYRVDAAAHSVELFASAESYFHLLELVRYYALAVEEARGTVVLQAAATVAGSGAAARAVAICGPKGAGKTTTMLRRVRAGRCSCLSGDRLLLRLDGAGQPRVRGWPDHPHVGLGTLAEDPALARRCGVDAEAELRRGRSPRDKLVLDPDAYYEGLLPESAEPVPLAGVLLPDVNAEEDGCRELPAARRLERLGGVVERPSSFVTATWHGMRPREEPPAAAEERALAALCELPWTEVRSRPRGAVAL